jgi:hypothetical protein
MNYVPLNTKKHGRTTHTQNMKQSVSTPAAARKTIKDVQDLPHFIPPFHPDLYLTQKCSYSNEEDGSVISIYDRSLSNTVMLQTWFHVLCCC